MFERADRLLPSKEGVTKHVLSYHWKGFRPHLIVYDGEAGEVQELPLDRLSMTVSEEKRCVGRFDDDGYRPCPQRRRVNAFSSCRSCMADRVPMQKCVFEPQCSGDRCGHPEFCGRLHVVYLALYGRLIKVGMTSKGRLMGRAVEQGADAVAPIFDCRDRMEARTLEKEVSSRFKIPQEIRIKKIAGQWTSPPSKDIMGNVYRTYLDRISRWRPALGAELTLLDRYPMSERPSSPPEVEETAGTHIGEVMGVKGRFMIFRKDGSSRLLELSDLPSRFVELV